VPSAFDCTDIQTLCVHVQSCVCGREVLVDVITVDVCLNYLLGVCGKLKIGLDLVFKTELYKNFTSVRTVFGLELHAIAIQIKSDKNNFTCILCADKECFKTLSKQIRF